MVQNEIKTPANDPVERVPGESYVPDAMWEEERIMAERASPARSLGAYDLRVSVKNLALPKPVTILATTTIRQAVALMQNGSFGSVLVVDAQGVLEGIFTERDMLLKISGHRLDWDKEIVGTFMTTNPETLGDTANLAFVLNLMTSGGFRHVPIVDEQKRPLAVVSIRDVVRYICSFFAKEVENLPPRPEILHPEIRESV